MYFVNSSGTGSFFTNPLQKSVGKCNMFNSTYWLFPKNPKLEKSILFLEETKKKLKYSVSLKKKNYLYSSLVN